MSESENTISRIKNFQNVGFLITDKKNKIVRTNYIGEEKST